MMRFFILSSVSAFVLASGAMAFTKVEPEQSIELTAEKITGIPSESNGRTMPNHNVKADDQGIITPVDLIQMANQLATLGRDRKDPYMLVSAARMLKSVKITEGEQTAEVTDEQSADQTMGGTGRKTPKINPLAAMNPESLLEEARTLADGDRDVLLAIQDASSMSAVGSVDGPHCHNARVSARTYRDYAETFRGGSPAVVSGRGDGDTDVDLFVYDENGNLICRDENISDRFYCRWVPRWTGPFRVRLVNLGSVYNDVRFCVN